jgi:tripartite-type tricarboxylate transporter receptor subunit TctC
METIMACTASIARFIRLRAHDFGLRQARGLAATLMATCALTLTSTGSDAHAQAAYPKQAVKILVGFPAGTAPDTLARLLADRFQRSLGQPVIVENTVGAGGNIAADRAAKAEPDGHVLLLAGNASLVVNQSLYEKLPFDPLKDFVPISQVAITPNVLVVHPDVAAKSVQELVALARAKPDELAYAHAGAGTSQHLAAEIVKHTAGINMRGVAYRGAQTALPDVVAGRVQVCFCNIATTLPLVREGKLRALAVTSSEPSPSAPGVPTMAASGFPGLKADSWFGLVAPAGTPPAIVSRLHADTAKLLTEPALVKTLTELGMIPVGNSPQAFATLIDAEARYWAGVLKTMALRIQ